MRDSLLPYKDQIEENLWALVQNEENNPAQRFQAAAALATYSTEDKRWQEVVPFVTQYLTSAVPSASVDDWIRLFNPARQNLTKPISAVHADRNRPARQREAAALALAQYWNDQPNELVNAVLIADEAPEFSRLTEALNPHASAVSEQLLDEMRARMPADLNKTNDQLSDENEQLRDAHWKRQALAAVALVHLGFAEDVWPLLEFTPNPSLRSFVVHYLGKLGTNHNTLAARLRLEEDVSIRRALIQCLGGLEVSQIPVSDRQRIAEHLKTLYENDPDSGVHSSASWALRKWREALPNLPIGEPALSEEQKQRMSALENQIKQIKAKIGNERVKRIAEWGLQISETYKDLPLTAEDAIKVHYSFDTLPDSENATTVKYEAAIQLHGDPKPRTTNGVFRGSSRK